MMGTFLGKFFTLLLVPLPHEEGQVGKKVLLLHVGQLLGQILCRGVLLFIYLGIQIIVLGIQPRIIAIAACCKVMKYIELNFITRHSTNT
jgi:hypothetical protein